MGSMGRFSAPKGGGGGGSPGGMNTIMPFIQQQAMMQALGQKQNMAAQSPSLQNPLQAAGIMPSQQQNFKQVPKTMEVGGVPQTIPTAEEKKDIPDTQLGEITSGRATANLLSQNVDRVVNDPAIRGQIGPLHLSAHQGMLGDIGMNFRAMMSDPNIGSFAEFKSNTADVFQNYRKFLEGVRGAVGGSSLINPILPEATDPPDIYVGKALGALEKMKQNDQILSDTLKGQNYKTGGIEGGFPVKDVNQIRDQAVGQGINVARNPVPGMPQSQGQMPQQQEPTGRIKVRNNATNQNGTISESSFDPKKYTRL